MKRNCTVLVLLLALLLCVGCSNPSDKVEGKLPEKNDLMATPADVLRNLVPQVNTVKTMSKSLTASDNPHDSTPGNSSGKVESAVSYLLGTPNQSKIFEILLSNDVADALEKDPTRNVFSTDSSEAYSIQLTIDDYSDAFLKWVLDNGPWGLKFPEEGDPKYDEKIKQIREMLSQGFSSLTFSYIKIFKDEANDTATIHFIADTSGTPNYCVMNCKKNTEFNCLDTVSILLEPGFENATDRQYSSKLYYSGYEALESGLTSFDNTYIASEKNGKWGINIGSTYPIYRNIVKLDATGKYKYSLSDNDKSAAYLPGNKKYACGFISSDHGTYGDIFNYDTYAVCLALIKNQDQSTQYLIPSKDGTIDRISSPYQGKFNSVDKVDKGTLDDNDLIWNCYNVMQQLITDVESTAFKKRFNMDDESISNNPLISLLAEANEWFPTLGEMKPTLRPNNPQQENHNQKKK